MNKEMIEKIVKAMELEEGQVVLINFWGEEADRDILHNFANAAASCGASPIEWMQSRTLNADLFEHMTVGYSEKFYQIYDCVDVLDEKKMGSFHIALGENRMFGGTNACPFHMDFVTMGEVK